MIMIDQLTSCGTGGLYFLQLQSGPERQDNDIIRYCNTYFCRIFSEVQQLTSISGAIVTILSNKVNISLPIFFISFLGVASTAYNALV